MRLPLKNRGLWHKAIHEARWLLVTCVGLMVLFHWIYVWVTSRFEKPAIAGLLEGMSPELRNLFGMEPELIVTVAGRIGLGYIDPVVLLISAAWATSRGSDVVSGEINRGSMEMLLAQPIRRIDVLITQSVVAVVGAALLGVAAYVGTAAGVATVTLKETVDPHLFRQPAFNLFAVTLFMAGVSTMVSSWDQYRWRTVGLLVGFYVVGMLLQVIGRSVPDLDWVLYFTFLAAYEPQAMVAAVLADPVNGWDEAWRLSLRYNAILLGLGMAAYGVAAIVFTRRDIPAPL